MEKIKVILDREKITSEEIASRQDLNSVLKGATTTTPVWKSGWFYGTVGLASVAIVAITATWNQSTNVESQNERILTASVNDSNVTPTAEKPQNAIQVSSTVIKEVLPEEQTKIEIKEEKPAPVKAKIEKTEEEMLTEDDQTLVDSKPVSYTSVAPKPDHSVAKVNGVVNKMPNIAGVYYGPISIDKLCSDNKIASSPDIEITSFKINYYNGADDVVKAVSGDIIPENICNEIRSASLNSTVFITEIRGVSKHGETLMLSSMSLIPTK